MRAITVFRALGPIDVRSIGRDSFLGWMLLLPLLFCTVLRFGLPAFSDWLAADYAFDLLPYYPLVMSFVLVQTVSTVVGTIIGLLLLDERDDDTLRALLVTPLPLEGYLAYRIGVPLVLAMTLSLFAVEWTGLVMVPWQRLGPIALLYALEAPMLALAIASACENKVQGLAFVKGIGIVPIIAAVSWFVAAPWQYLAGITPTWWPVKAFWIASEGGDGYWTVIAIGLAVHVIGLWLLLAAFRRKVHRRKRRLTTRTRVRVGSPRGRVSQSPSRPDPRSARPPAKPRDTA